MGDLPSTAAAKNSSRSSREGIREYFEEATVEIVECPDLSAEPFGFTGQGIGSELRIAESVCATCELPHAFVFGPGAAHRRAVGVNCEMVADAVFSEDGDKVNTHVCKIKGDRFEQSTTSDPCGGPLANLAISKNERGKPVLRIAAKRRKTELNFPASIRKILFEHYRAKVVSMCGVFRLETGKALVHVMPDFPERDFFSRDELQNEWLQYFEVDAPLVCATVIHSHDPLLHLRLEHTHVFSAHGDGGHFHYDTSKDEASYVGYFKPAQMLYRIDKVDPKTSEEEAPEAGDSVFQSFGLLNDDPNLKHGKLL
ncbi:Ester hydrolase C11orf54-like protein [Aphelenchoides fujianensis]|nr:Ester hydrolase C11orf54-like protein [Aphelenchoides fujianensis]